MIDLVEVESEVIETGIEIVPIKTALDLIIMIAITIGRGTGTEIGIATVTIDMETHIEDHLMHITQREKGHVPKGI